MSSVMGSSQTALEVAGPVMREWLLVATVPSKAPSQSPPRGRPAGPNLEQRLAPTVRHEAAWFEQEAP